MAQANHSFYSKMPVNRKSLSDLLLNDSAFYDVPADWQVIITDIKGSTSAVLGGSSENVNYVATGSIVTVLNLAFKANSVFLWWRWGNFYCSFNFGRIGC